MYALGNPFGACRIHRAATDRLIQIAAAYLRIMDLVSILIFQFVQTALRATVAQGFPLSVRYFIYFFIFQFWIVKAIFEWTLAIFDTRQLLPGFELGFAVNTISRGWSGLKPLNRYLLFTVLAKSVAPVFDILQGVLDFSD